jgi:hypothetical protein
MCNQGGELKLQFVKKNDLFFNIRVHLLNLETTDLLVK